MYEIIVAKDGKHQVVGRSYTLRMATERASRYAHKGIRARIEDPRTDEHWDFYPVYSDKSKKAKTGSGKKTKAKNTRAKRTRSRTKKRVSRWL